MIKLRYIYILVLFLSLAACDDQPATRSTQDYGPRNTQALTEIEKLEARVAMNPMDFESLSALADMYFESAQYINAFQTYDKAIAINPGCADCYNDRGLCLFYIGDATSALESFDKAVAIDPTFIHAWLSKGFVLISEARYQEAVAPLNKVKELDTTGAFTADADRFLATAAEHGFQ